MSLYTLVIFFMLGVLFAGLLARKTIRDLNRRLSASKATVASLESRLNGLKAANDSLRSASLVVEKKNAILVEELANLHSERQAAWGIPNDF